MEVQLRAGCSPRGCVEQQRPLLEVSRWSQEEALGFYFTWETLFFNSFLHSANTLCSISFGVFTSILRDLQCIFSDYITSEKAFGPNYIIKDKTEGLLALLPLFWKNSSPLIESTWFTAKLDGGNHLTEILDDSGGKRYPLFVLLSPDCHHPFPSSQEKLPALGLTLRSAGGGHALELAVSHILFFDPGLWKRHFVKAEIVIRLTWVMWPKEQMISLAH